MMLGALMDAGADIDGLKAELAKLDLSHYELDRQTVFKKGIRACQAIVRTNVSDRPHPHRRLADIRAMIDGSRLDVQCKAASIEVFTRLAQAEAIVHGTSIEEVHFHEVGAVDAIVDVVGSVIGLSLLGIEKVVCSPLNVGSGTVKCAHGILPVPAPATAELIRGRPVYSSGVAAELLTPTGAALLTTLAAEFGPMPAMTLEKVGYGAGCADLEIANLLRLAIGKSQPAACALDSEQVAVLETNIDDMNPQVYDHLMDHLLAMGAMDVFLTPLLMKKNRPGTLLTVLCPLAMVARAAHFIIAETTTIGLRWRIDERLKAARVIRTIETDWGPIRVKVASMDGRTVNVSPEYEDCRQVAQAHKVPLKNVMEAARAAAKGLKSGD
jgi:uncharacterized protein (TIGR00299 family) protein